MTPKLKAFLAQPNRDITLPFDTGYGYLIWYNLQSQRYRDNDLPVVVYDDGRQEWRTTKDQFHRVNGPAITHPDGDDIYCLEGVEYTYEDWLVERTKYLPKHISRYKRLPLL